MILAPVEHAWLRAFKMYGKGVDDCVRTVCIKYLYTLGGERAHQDIKYVTVSSRERPIKQLEMTRSLQPRETLKDNSAAT